MCFVPGTWNSAQRGFVGPRDGLLDTTRTFSWDDSVRPCASERTYLRQLLSCSVAHVPHLYAFSVWDRSLMSLHLTAGCWYADDDDDGHIIRHLGSLHPIGIIAAAIVSTPLSVARRLNCEAAFLVSCTSTRIPIALIIRRVSGERGYMVGPRPRIRRSMHENQHHNDPEKKYTSLAMEGFHASIPTTDQASAKPHPTTPMHSLAHPTAPSHLACSVSGPILPPKVAR